MTELVTDSDRETDEEAATSNISDAVTFGPRESQVARAREITDPTGNPDGTASADTDSDMLPADDEALRAFYGTVGRAGGAFRTALAGPMAWPVFNRRHPSVLEVFQHAQASPGWDHPALLTRLPVRLFWRFDSCWETACMIARVWFRTRITWAINLILIIAFLVWWF